MMKQDLFLRNVELQGTPGWDVRIESGLVSEIGRDLEASGDVIDGGAGALLPGLQDRHVHLLATAANRESANLENAESLTELIGTLGRAAANIPAGAWLRGTGFDLTAFPEVSIELLDRLFPQIPIRLQDRTGALWLLNTAAIRRLAAKALPDGYERDPSGALTGRVWREDAWMATNIPRCPPLLGAIGRELSSYGITSVTDASATQTEEGAAILAAAHRSGELPQHLVLMSRIALRPPTDGAFEVGPVKVLIDERDLPSLDAICDVIREARAQERCVAVHCVTETELALTLAAFETVGSIAGDRIEHGSVISQSSIDVIRQLGLRVATQPSFIESRGDRYLRDISTEEHENLYRCASLLAAGVTVYGSSDAPYGSLDPWAAMRTATMRRTRRGQSLGAAEQVSPSQALALFLGPQIRIAARADLCLLKCSLETALRDQSADNVACTVIGGRIVYTSPGTGLAGPKTNN